MRIDTHHHLWRYDPLEYPWIDDYPDMLQRDYLVPDLQREATEAKVTATVAVQARQNLAETNWLLSVAESSKLIRGVVGWADIASLDFQMELAALKERPLLKGLRHVVQGEPEGFLDGPAFNCGATLLEPTGLVYDLLIFAHQIRETLRFIDRHPRQRFVLDHIAKPAIAKGEYKGWAVSIAELARRENVVCKLSGMVTQADWKAWKPDQLRPYFEHVLRVFGPNRLMIGTDWPVLTVACSYSEWWSIVERWIEPLSSSERSLIEGQVAEQIYRLDVCSGLVEETT